MEIVIRPNGKLWSWVLQLPNNEAVMGDRASPHEAWNAAWNRWVRFQEEEA